MMTTKLNKCVSREFARPAGKALIITLKPEGIIGIREKGTRAEFEISIEGAYWIAAKKEAERKVAERREKRRRKNF